MFVYGTLCTTERRRGWAAQAELTTPVTATTPGGIWSYRGAFPYAVFDRSYGEIVGQYVLMDAEHEAFLHMDLIETNSGYHRTTVEVTLPDGSTTTALAYQADATTQKDLPFLPRVLSGDWNDLKGVEAHA